MTEPDFGWTVL